MSGYLVLMGVLVCVPSGGGESGAELRSAAGGPPEAEHHHRSSEAAPRSRQQTHHRGVLVRLGNREGGAPVHVSLNIHPKAQNPSESCVWSPLAPPGLCVPRGKVCSEVKL